MASFSDLLVNYPIPTGVIIGAIPTAISFYLWFKGVSPVLIRLGRSLSKSKIAILAKGSNKDTVENILRDAGLFSNIKRIEEIGEINSVEPYSVLIVYWPDWKDEIEGVLREKKAETAVIVYAPKRPDPSESKQDEIPYPMLVKINSFPNSMVVNFKGRLLNDVVTCMVTRSYIGKK